MRLEESELRACEGGLTDYCANGIEHGQVCRACGMWVRDDMTDHFFYGFAAGCELDDAALAAKGE